jgi:hypothetical protein
MEALGIGIGTGLGVLLMIGATGLLLFVGYSLVIRAKRSSSLNITNKKNLDMKEKKPEGDQEKADSGSEESKKYTIHFTPSKTTAL